MMLRRLPLLKACVTTPHLFRPRSLIASTPAFSSSKVRRITTTSPGPHRTAIVTGSARGIGKAIALRLARDGYSVTVNDLPSLQSELDTVCAEIHSAYPGVSAYAHAADVTSPDEVSSLVAASVANIGPLTTMVANAGIAQVKPLLDLTPEDFTKMFAVNVQGVHYCYQAAAKQLISQNTPGKLIAAASIVAFKPFGLLGHYSASKWAVRGLSQVYAMELAQHKITVNAYAPGIVDTNMWEVIDEGLVLREGKEKGVKKGDMLRKFSEEKIALGRTSVPEDVANLVGCLASKDADYITGQTMVVDGGIVYT
ncbi:3-oxoacyl-reductase [Podospora australis]|uniref:3-oxoacyl-reductase n=1 Tax=Podospora australis TaxID=1536484 RepID=A0AAN6WW88_9PEZI|nr:3-oxoacyl-reductase [Podospora australis]